MRGLTKAAALLLAPALARASFLNAHDSKSDTRTPLAVVDFDVPTGRHGIESLALKVDVEESEDICGETDLSINGNKLTYNEHGSGSGDVRVGDKTVTAHWLLSCVMTHMEPEAQLLRFAIDKINGHSVDVSELLLTFRKTSPALVLDFHGALEKTHKSNGEGHHKGEMPDPDDELEAQIQELELLHAQAAELMELIEQKEMAIQERFGGRGGSHRRPPPPPPGFATLRDCDSIQCVVHTLTEKVKHTAGNLCPEWLHGHGPHGHGPGPHGDHPHGPPKHKFPGNHSHPAPPHHRPPFCPPCHGPPEGAFPPPPYHGERPPPPGDERPFPPPPDHDEPSDELPPPPPGHGDHPPPPPQDEEHGHRHGEHDHDFPPMESKDGENHPHPPHHGGPPHHEHGPHGHDHHGPPPKPVIMILGMAAIALAICSVIGIAYIHRRINRLTPESRRAIRRAIRRSDSDRRSRRNDRPKSRLQRLLARWTGDFDDEEKESMLRGRSDSEDSVTMEQEIARFREAAFMVEGLVAAEEGRNAHRMHPHYYHHPPPPPPPPHHPHHQHPHGPPPPPPPPPPPRPPMIPEHIENETGYPGFVPNERLPSYDDETCDSSVVSDGCRGYTPGSSDYTPSETAANTNDVLGDSKKN